MSGMDSLGKVWDGYEWVIPEIKPIPKAPSQLHEPSSRKYGVAESAFKEQQETQKQLVALQREVERMRTRQRKLAHQERKEADVQALKREQARLTGKEKLSMEIAELAAAKVEAADERDVAEFSQQLNNCLSTEYDAARDELRHNHRWIRLFKEMDTDGFGRVGFKAFKKVIRGRFRAAAEREASTKAAQAAAAAHAAELAALPKPPVNRRKPGSFFAAAAGGGGAAYDGDDAESSVWNDDLESVSQAPPSVRGGGGPSSRRTRPSGGSVTGSISRRQKAALAFNGYMPQSDELRRVWRALDQDDEGSLRGYITVEEFTSFMRKGMPAPDERSSEEKIRERGAAARNRVAVDESTYHTTSQAGGSSSSSDALPGSAEWKRLMERVPIATDDQLTKLSTRLNNRLSYAGYSSWYKAFKTVDTDGSGRLGWTSFCTLVRELLGTLDLDGTAAPHPPREETSTAELKDRIRGGGQAAALPTNVHSGPYRDGRPVYDNSHNIHNTSSISSGSANNTHHELDPLRSVWRHLDPDGTGFLAVGEFAAFMRLGAPPSTKRNQPRGAAHEQAAAAAGRAPRGERRSAIREAVRQSDGASKESQVFLRRDLDDAKREQEERALRLKETLKQMKHEEEVRAYRLQREQMRQREAEMNGGGGGAPSTSYPPPQRPGLFRQGESKGLLPGSQSARLTEQSRLSLPPIPKTSRSYEETEEEKARREHQRMLATYNRVQRRGFNPLSREPPVSVL